ncbi:PaaI family thioesterase [Effusibacillus consociatus]|uniref:PaaI family thioesterase n=1 Tax=Effusibacillus consociatus TaxID=1117041 RepID=A0ABV9Q8Y1_9BACL
MSNSNDLQELRDYFSTVPFWQYIGCVIEEVEEGHAVLSLKIGQQHLNGNMTVHGGVYATLLDNAMGLASRAEAGRFQATTHMNVHFVAAVSEGTIYARGRTVHRTKRTVTTEARVEKEDGTLLAMATGTFRVFQEPVT